jgi:hypothetical protein
MAAGSAVPRPPRQLKVYTRQEIEALIAEGRYIFILDGIVIRADTWLKSHPGGPKAIEHMVGRDATDEVRAYVTGRELCGTKTNVHPLGYTHWMPKNECKHTGLGESREDGETSCPQYKAESSSIVKT